MYSYWSYSLLLSTLLPFISNDNGFGAVSLSAGYVNGLDRVNCKYLQITMITIDAAFTATEFFIREVWKPKSYDKNSTKM